MNATALALIQYLTGAVPSPGSGWDIGAPPPTVPAAVAWISVADYESGLYPGPQAGNTGGVLGSAAVGLGSWNGPRQQSLADFATQKGIPWENIYTQALFFFTEAEDSYPTVWAAYQEVQNAYRSSMTTEEVVALANTFITVIVNDYEIPANPAPEIAGAQASAASWLASGQITAPTQTPAPVNTQVPVISPNSPVVGTPVTTTNGTWSNAPTSYTYQWQSGGANVGTNSDQYTPVASDVGKALTVAITATNAGGSASATSMATQAVTAVITPPPPPPTNLTTVAQINDAIVILKQITGNAEITDIIGTLASIASRS